MAAFELLNEANGGAMGVAFMYDELREEDPDRLFLIWEDPKDATLEWSNVIYGPHIYGANGPRFEDSKAVIDREV